MGDRLEVRSAALAVVLVLAVSVAAASCASEKPSATHTPSTRARATTNAGLPAGLDAVVVSVTDGDTITVRLDTGGTEKVRLIGIDTPETKDPRTVVECFGAEASARTHALLPTRTAVRLETDVERRDRYGRFLAYVWRVDDGLFVNEALVKDGWAAPYRFPPNVKYADRFSQLGAEAREANAGLWGACGGTNTPAASAAPANGTVSGCDPNYAGACVPISATDLDCSDIGAHNLQVVGTDVHRLDGNHDAVACE
ncbi:MAG: thermonuclease family protein [Acidimicrobiia bacterium]